MERIIIRIEKNHDFVEDGTAILIFPDAPASKGFVLYCGCLGHGEGIRSALVHDSRPITQEELKAFNGNIYGYDLANFRRVLK